MTHQGIPAVSQQDLQGKDPQEIATTTKIPVIWCDHQATRRQRLHGITYPDEAAAWSSSHLVEVLDHMEETGYTEAIFMAEDVKGWAHAVWVSFAKLPDL